MIHVFLNVLVSVLLSPHALVPASFEPVVAAAVIPVQEKHIPTLVVAGKIITIDADIAWFDNPLPPGAKLVQGTTLAGQDSLAASTDGSSPIIWELPASGDYPITAYGFPIDRKFPQRSSAGLMASIAPVTRQDEIRETFVRLTMFLYEVDVARKDLLTLAPTREEIGTAFGP